MPAHTWRRRSTVVYTVTMRSRPQGEKVRLEGKADLAARKLTLCLWQGGGSAANAADAAEMLIEENKCYARRLGAAGNGRGS